MCAETCGAANGRVLEQTENLSHGTPTRSYVICMHMYACTSMLYIYMQGSSATVTDRDAFVEYESIPAKAVYMGDNNKQDAVGQGSVKWCWVSVGDK